MKEQYKKGIEYLKNINGKTTEILINSMSYKQIADVFGVSESSSRRIMDKKIKEFNVLVSKEQKNDPVFEATPFSENEDDYGTSIHPNKQIITKGGLFIFKGNTPIKKIKKTFLGGAIAWYKETMKAYNQPLLNISHEKMIRYEND